MAAQIPAGKLNCAPSFSKPDWAGLSALWERQVASERRPTRNLVQSFEASTISVGHDDSDHLDAETKYDAKHTFGWDNEAPRRDVSVPAFKVSLLPISNADYHRFWLEHGRPESLTPGSWTVSSDGEVSIKVLTEPSRVDLAIGKDWPCMASGKQLEAYAKSVGGRLPTEPELRRFLEDHPVDHGGANIGFMNWHPVP
jgi:formylglycine-generating enzyme required for sulfatase activity